MHKIIEKLEKKFAGHSVCANMILGIVAGTVAGCIINILALLPKDISLIASIAITAVIVIITIIFFFVE
jgi:hypothetical protein